MQKSRDNKKTKDLYNDQTYESINQNRNVSYSISLQMINKNAIIFLSKEMSKQMSEKVIAKFDKNHY